MPDMSGLGALHKTLLAALDQMGSVVTASLTNMDGTPRGDLVFLHVTPGHPVEAKVYRDPWTPEDGFGAVRSVAPVAGASPPGGTSPPAGTSPAAAAGSAVMDSARAAARTAALVDSIYPLGPGVAIAEPGRASDAWGLLAGAMRAPLSLQPDVQKPEIDLAKSVLYVGGDPTKPTPGYLGYRQLTRGVLTARRAYNAAFMKAMGDPVLAESWGVDGLQYDEAIQEAMTDLAAANQNDSPLTYEDAETFMNTTQGARRADAAVAAVKARWNALGALAVGGGQEKLPYTYVDPVSWYDSTDNSFGVQEIDVRQSTYDAYATSNLSGFSSSYYEATRSSDSAGVGLVYGPYSATADFGVASSSSAQGARAGGGQSAQKSDHSTSASITGQYFLADVARPWLYDEIFRIREGWFLEDGDRNSISDGTASPSNNGKAFPAIVKSMLIARNVTITSDDWGEFASSASNWAHSEESHDESSATRFGGSASAFGIGGTYHHSDSDQSGNAFTSDDGSQGWSYCSSDRGGTLRLHGSQILGVILQVLPASPPLDRTGH
ncbi:hypothetical protein ACFWBV_12945 [Streptomyces sp. NPDC060030]|uniref:hypothetical protein n=1 Tax=Streptomyces sp. NPDC060030 TaxID=3347042 RepID=UPI0036BAD0DC